MNEWKKAGISAMVGIIFGLLFALLGMSEGVSLLAGLITYWGQLLRFDNM